MASVLLRAHGRLIHARIAFHKQSAEGTIPSALAFHVDARPVRMEGTARQTRFCTRTRLADSCENGIPQAKRGRDDSFRIHVSRLCNTHFDKRLALGKHVSAPAHNSPTLAMKPFHKQSAEGTIPSALHHTPIRTPLIQTPMPAPRSGRSLSRPGRPRPAAQRRLCPHGAPPASRPPSARRPRRPRVWRPD